MKNKVTRKRTKRLFIEIETVPEWPRIRWRMSIPGLEKKHGEVCLVRPISIETLGPGKYRVRREWLRPGRQPFSRFIYGRVKS